MPKHHCCAYNCTNSKEKKKSSAITIRSELLEKLEPMVDVMADRGFNLRDLVTKRNATLNIPQFAKGKPVLTKACTKTRRIASLRIHVERAI